VLEIMRNIHVFVSKYLYNLNNQVDNIFDNMRAGRTFFRVCFETVLFHISMLSVSVFMLVCFTVHCTRCPAFLILNHCNNHDAEDQYRLWLILFSCIQGL